MTGTLRQKIALFFSFIVYFEIKVEMWISAMAPITSLHNALCRWVSETTWPADSLCLAIQDIRSLLHKGAAINILANSYEFVWF